MSQIRPAPKVSPLKEDSNWVSHWRSQFPTPTTQVPVMGLRAQEGDRATDGGGQDRKSAGMNENSPSRSQAGRPCRKGGGT